MLRQRITPDQREYYLEDTDIREKRVRRQKARKAKIESARTLKDVEWLIKESLEIINEEIKKDESRLLFYKQEIQVDQELRQKKKKKGGH